MWKTPQCTQILFWHFILCEVNTNAVFPNNICDLYYNHLHLFQSTVTAVAKLVRTIHFHKKFTVWPQHLMLLSLIFPIWPLISISEGWNNFDKYLSSVWGVVVMRQVTLLEYYNTACKLHHKQFTTKIISFARNLKGMKLN